MRHFRTETQEMRALMEYLQSIWSHLSSIQIVDILDIIIVSFLIYKIIPIFKTTNTARIARVVVVILVIAWLTDAAKLHTLNFVLNQFLSIGLLACTSPKEAESRRAMKSPTHCTGAL